MDLKLGGAEETRTPDYRPAYPPAQAVRRRVLPDVTDWVGRSQFLGQGGTDVELATYGFRARYSRLTPVSGCPRDGGAMLPDGTCLQCGWDGPTHVATLAEQPGRPVQTSKHTRTRMPRSDVRERAAG